MCGIAGAFLRRSLQSDDLRAIANAMSAPITHRGPDDAGEFLEPAVGLAMAFRRLAIIDVSPAGHQPMVSASGRYVITYNGEFYNFEAVRRELETTGSAPRWRGHSDTEVMLAAFEAWGLEGALGRFIGMFAIALWDTHRRTLHLMRDRMGVKPLYYSIARDSLLYASELKALVAHPEFDAEIDREAVALYSRFGYVPAPHTIYRSTWKLTPGSILSVPESGAPLEPKRYWDVRAVAAQGIRTRFQGTEVEAVDAVEHLLRDAVGLRMISDVPLGVFLSGGIDSTLVTAVMQSLSSTPVKTFTIGMESADYDEAGRAAAVARHLGTSHTSVTATADEARAVVPLLSTMYDEPFADSSQIPTFLVSRLARRSVTVSLSGDGGDELFGGYNRYFLGRRLWGATRRIPEPLRPLVSAVLRSIPRSAWDWTLSRFKRRLPALRERAGDRLHKLALAMKQDRPDVLYRSLVTQWEALVPDARVAPIAIDDDSQLPSHADVAERMMYFDQISYLVDDILVKVDRASMAVSLEAREPLLDHRLVELAWSLPLDVKLRDGRGKWVLRQVLGRYLPASVGDGPKMGFAVPLGDWLRGPLRPWAEDLLSESRLREEGFFDVRQVRSAWSSHLRGGNEWQQHLWTVLMFEAWYRSRRSHA
jgi:asparagine synthase (glutamine-hydrolysing)